MLTYFLILSIDYIYDIWKMQFNILLIVNKLLILNTYEVIIKTTIEEYNYLCLWGLLFILNLNLKYLNKIYNH